MTDATDATDATGATGATGATDAGLDALLRTWGTSQRLDQADADELLATILGPETRPETRPETAAEPARLPATWWAGLSEQVAAAVVLATARPGEGSLAAA
jgi:hypothetical protein